MQSLSIICVVSLIRVLVEFALGIWVSLVALGWDGEGFLAYHHTARPEAGDREAFYILGGALLSRLANRSWMRKATLFGWRARRYSSMQFVAWQILVM